MRYKCGDTLDAFGNHRASCSTVWILKQRAGPLERAWARVCREAGDVVKTNKSFGNLNLPRIQDKRAVEIL